MTVIEFQKAGTAIGGSGRRFEHHFHDAAPERCAREVAEFLGGG